VADLKKERPGIHLSPMFERGFLTVGKVFGAPLRVHWSAPLGLLITGFFVWPIALGTGLVILLHELGHAVVARRMGVRVVRIDVLPFGGRCLWSGNPRPMERAAIAWGGVLAQLLLLLVTAGLVKQLGFPQAGILDGLCMAFTLINGLLLFTNLIPVEPLDGAEAWPLLRMAWRNARRARLQPRRSVAARVPHVTARALDRAEVPPELAKAMREALEQARRG
jgi:Zn-dependent protease